MRPELNLPVESWIPCMIPALQEELRGDVTPLSSEVRLMTLSSNQVGQGTFRLAPSPIRTLPRTSILLRSWTVKLYLEDDD